MLEQAYQYAQRLKAALYRRVPLLAPRTRGGLHHQLYTLILMAFALWLRLLIAPVEAGLQYVTFFPSVTLAAFVGGLYPGLIATFIGIIFATYFFTAPFYDISLASWQNGFWANLLFLLDGLILSISFEALHRYRKKFSDELEQTKLAHAELRKSEEQLQLSIKAGNIGIWELNIQNGTANYSEEWKRQLGYSTAEIRASADEWLSRLPPEDKDSFLQTLRTYIEHPWPGFKTEYRLLHKDGTYRWMLSQAALANPSNSATQGLRGAQINITERKQAELLMLEYKGAIETTHDGFWAIDRYGIVQEVNQAYCELSGYARNELLGMHVSQLDSHERSDAEVNAHMSMIIARGWDVFETRHRRKDGSEVELEVSAAYIADAGRFIAFVRNISERKRAEAEIRIAATAFETHEAIMITDAHANIVRVNQAFQEITGYSAEEVIGKNPRILSSGRQDKNFYQAMWQHLLDRGSWTGEIWDKRKSGQIYPKWLTITAVKNELRHTTEYVAIFSDITARKEAEAEIYSLAYYDMLTKLPNRRFLLDRAHQAQAISARSHLYGALLFLDMDRFKTLNDTLGHDVGDLFLVEVAKRIQANVRESDTIARIGGDEFVVLIEEIAETAEDTSQRVALIAEKIRSALSAPYFINDQEHHSSPSIGVSLYFGNNEKVEALLKHADLAMYQAKEAGRNAVRFFDPAMQLAVESRAHLEADLRHAITAGQLQLYYQIQLDGDLRPLGAEALIRWKHPARGMVPPAQFIPLAEESSLILDIGLWVLENACKQLRQWSQDDRTRNLILAVNVSAQQFNRYDFVDSLTRLLNIHQVNPNHLKLELTESVVLSDVADVITKMHELKALGIRLSLDDFGTGYSSLSYLKRLPLDQIKIDQSFVRDVTTDPGDAVMVRTIITLAQNFRINVIAEGVETQSQLDFLRSNGCMAYQGYLFSKPVPIEQFNTLVNYSAPPPAFHFDI